MAETNGWQNGDIDDTKFEIGLVGAILLGAIYTASLFRPVTRLSHSFQSSSWIYECNKIECKGESENVYICGKQIFLGKLLEDFIAKNKKTKVVLKLQKNQSGPTAREPVMTEEDMELMMMYAYRNQEERKKVEEDEVDAHLGSESAEGDQIKRQFQGLRSINWKPK
ncbi:unnamed protein product [Orchesella dallaii]|uniref:Uncharacterized protein n=1 Tax=Orchesella dallaii TaxID=48710 RepID=A0ABP1RTC3_9HEXA